VGTSRGLVGVGWMAKRVTVGVGIADRLLGVAKGKVGEVVAELTLLGVRDRTVGVEVGRAPVSCPLAASVGVVPPLRRPSATVRPKNPTAPANAATAAISRIGGRPFNGDLRALALVAGRESLGLLGLR
jgi:hypothetical protein